MAEQKKIEDKKVIPFDNCPLKTEAETSLNKEDIPIKASVIEKVNEPKIIENKPSISGAIFSMTALSIGTGCLTFTKKVIQFGFVGLE